jgi:hypothetical protein
MPYLGDYLGHLLSEITIARVQADLEAVRVAELYASHPLLRHLPIPHFRLPTVTLDVPVIIKEMEEAKTDESPRGGVVLSAMRKSFDRILALHLNRADIKLSDTEKKDLTQALDQTISRLAQPPYISISVLLIADELVFTAIKALGDPEREGGALESVRLEKLANELKTAVRLEFLNLRQAPPRLLVLVTTAELREAGPQELLAHFHLSISEEAFEWTVIESHGKSLDKLVPE